MTAGAITGLVHDAPLPTLFVGPDNVVVEANSAATDLLEVAGGRTAVADLVAGPAATEAWRRLNRGESAELALRRRGGGTIWVIARARSLPVGLLVGLADVSRYKRRERELLRQKGAAEQALWARMRFFAAASHDLRQPLQALALFVSVLDRHVGTDGQVVLQSIRASLKTMEDMFNALLDMSRLDAGILKAQPAVFMVNDLLESLEGEFARQAEAGGQRLQVMPSSQAVRSDPALLMRILRNFLSNALRYARGARILVGCRRRGSQLRIEVWDTGPGISDEQKQRIFQEFYQGSGAVADEPPGVGLGLAIVQRLASLLEHQLDLRSAPGRGSVFSVTVPRADEDGVRDAEDEDIGVPPDLSGVSVVVVDDDRDILEGLRLLFDEWGCRAVLATGAEDAVSAMTRDNLRPDIILADLRLGGSSCGIAAIEAILAGLPSDVPALLFSGDTNAGDAGEQGRFPLLRKPIDPLSLRRALGRTLGRG